jgi:hypothetical protein
MIKEKEARFIEPPALTSRNQFIEESSSNGRITWSTVAACSA